MANGDQYFADAEDTLRRCEFQLPIAWALGWLVDNEKLLLKVLKKANELSKHDQLIDLVAEIKQGVSYER